MTDRSSIRRAGTFLLLASMWIAGPASAAAQATDAASDDRAAVRAAILDYVEALYQVAPERIARSVHPDLVKLGFYRDRDGVYVAAPMTYQQLHDLAGRWNTDNRRGITDATARDIVVFDVLDKTASAKLVADWGIDYFHLVKHDGTWQIVQVLWQSHP